MIRQVVRRFRGVGVAFLAVVTASVFTIATAPPARAEACSDVDVVFARGTLEFPGLGVTGRPLVDGIALALTGRTVTSHAVDYPADITQSQAGLGASDMADHVNSTARQCPATAFVIGGYSQGGSVTDIAMGIPTTLGTGRTISTENAPRVKAVVVFGNPLRLSGRTIRSSSPTYGPKSIEFCNFGDPVCGNGANPGAHLTYPYDGSVDRGVAFAVDQLRKTQTVATRHLV